MDNGSKQTLSSENTRKKRRILIIAILSVIVLTGIIAALFCIFSDNNSSGSSSGKKRDPFEKLYIDQSRESVQKAYGTPDQSSDYDPDAQYSWNIDHYYNERFLGERGTLSVWYSNDGYVTHAWFDYNYSDSDPSSEDRDDAREYALEIIEYYTKKYGDPEAGYYDYEWSLPDGSEIGLTYDLSPESLASVITIKWG